MKSYLYRAEPGRLPVVEGFRGTGYVSKSGETFRFHGVDASHHGFGCVLSRHVIAGSTVVIHLGHHRVPFEVMWCESHLGIENMYRVGLTSSDPHINIEHILSELGYLALISRHAS